MILGMTDAEREQHHPGSGVVTNGVTRWTDRHMNLKRSLADVYELRVIDWGNGAKKVYWINRDTGRVD